MSKIAKGKYKEWLAADNLLRIEGWARDGLSDKQIAQNMGISKDTYYQWMKLYPAFSDAVKRGKAPADIEIENALFKRAIGGYEVEEKRIEKWKDPDGVERDHTVIIKRQVPPDTTAMIFWLKNRKPEKWRDRRVEDVVIGTANYDALNEAFEELKGNEP